MEKYREFEHAVHWLVRAYSSSWEQDIEICLQKYEYETDHENIGYFRNLTRLLKTDLPHL